MEDEYNLFQSTTWILYININNFYEWAMSQFLLIGKYKQEKSQIVLSNKQNL